ncbi:MAG: hypothetical protein AAF597_12460, partial [Bacteroidota bacterium]
MKYIERQKFNQWWLWLLLFVTLGFTFFPLVQAVLAGAFSASLLVGPAVVAAVMIFIATLELRTTITQDGIEVKFWPIITKRIFRSEIEGAAVRKYSPLGDYGGWGYRISLNGTAINMQGNQGMLLALKDGQKLMIGTQQPEALAKFMKQYLAAEEGDDLEQLKLRD